ncbi:MAG: DUF4080 domain-containing protein [Myxococcales bacterium FL481]|nr:MAG: DUF4080 domain-containing protein [Myxococcales bacterium FL481]
MTDILLTTLNAKYAHTAFGLRYLAANMGPLGERTAIAEFTIDQRPVEVVEAIVAAAPKIVGLGVYIWNAEACHAIAELLRRVAPKVCIVVGGPEVSHEIEDQPWLRLVDYVVQGEGDERFPQLCARILEGRRPLQRVLDGGQPDLASLRLPYSLYSDHDLEHRVVYVEASRGCPYRCEFCLSSLDQRVRSFPLNELLAAFDELMVRGARQFKFVDRTFNLDLRRSAAILEFFLSRVELGLFLHFEMVPDRLPDALRGLIAQFPAGSLQFEVGIQTFDEAVGGRIQRRQNIARTFENLDFLREHTQVHLHTDLIIGLPGEPAETFGVGLDRLIAAGVQEVQVGVLKRLRGTPISRHAEAFAMVFEPRPPYAILSNRDIDFPAMQRLKRFALVWDTFWNRGDFARSMRALWGDGSPFAETLALADVVYSRRGRVHGISLENRAAILADQLVVRRGYSRDAVATMIHDDFDRHGRRPPPLWRERKRSTKGKPNVAVPVRQQRHLQQRG